MSEIGDWYRTMPRFTKFWLSSTVFLSLLARERIIPFISSKYLILDWHLVLYEFQIWRLVTALFYYPTCLHFLVNCAFMYEYSVRLEEYYRGTPSEYLFLLIFNYTCCLLIDIITSFKVLMDPMVLSVLYVWSQLHKTETVSFWFGTRFKAVHLPWILWGFSFIIGISIYSFVGIVVGHSYYFLKYEYLRRGGKSLLETPGILKRYFPNVREAHGFRVFAPENHETTPPNNGMDAMGPGHVLGR